jgi:5-methylcytosine-specific restriction endonuclease McrA
MKEVARECMVALRESINKRTEEQLVGQTFNRLTVIRFHNFDSSQQAAKLWLCKCACGKEVTVRTNALVTGRTKSCGCWRKESRMLEPGIGMRNHLLQIYKAAAKRRGHSWELVNEQFDVLTQGDCHYCGEPPSDRKHSSRFNGACRCNGIDRKNNTKGYVFENCVSACWSCNRMKGTMPYDKFIAFLRKAGKFQLEKPNTASLSREAHAV